MWPILEHYEGVSKPELMGMNPQSELEIPCSIPGHRGLGIRLAQQHPRLVH